MYLAKSLITTISIILLFTGCTVTKIFRTGTYSIPENNKELTLVIYLVDPLLRIDFFGNFDDKSVKGDLNERIYNFYKKQLCIDIDSLTIFKNIHFDQLTSDYATRNVSVRIPARGEKLFELPVNNSKVEFSHNKADFILFLDEISIVSRYHVDESRSYEPVYDPYSSPLSRRRRPLPPVNPSRNLTYESKFILWDNISKVPVSYGYVREVNENKKEVIMDDWLKVSAMYVNKLFEGTPFQTQKSTSE